MTAKNSSAEQTYPYQPTLLDTKPLLTRLAVQLDFARNEFKRDPPGFAMQLVQDLTANKTALFASLVVAVTLLLVIDNATAPRGMHRVEVPELMPEMVFLDPGTGPSLAGFNVGAGAGSGPISRPAHGGGGGGDHDRNPPQSGKLPPPSTIPAAIPIDPPVNPQSLPVAGIVLDPALWKDLNAPVYGDPRSNSGIPSKGPGEGEGIGTSRGVGIGAGDGPGVGPGSEGNTGGRVGQTGCCGEGGGSGEGASGRGVYVSAQVDERVRLIAKPEPQYTEEARRNQIVGRVVLRAVFASSGEVVDIQALSTLPFGLTERSIAAARQIKFVPAKKNGRPVSVYLNLEYNFNLY